MTIDQQRFPPVRSNPKQYDCCRLIRTLSPSLLPLARRGRPHVSNRSPRLLCSNCNAIKRQLQIDILKTEQIRQLKTSNESSFDLNHLTDEQKKHLLEEMIRKLQIVLNNHPTIHNYTDDHFQLTYRTLQTTLSLLSSSSSHDPI